MGRLSLAIGTVLAVVSTTEPAFAQSAPKATPTPRVLLRDPFGVPAAKLDEVMSTVASAVKEAGALSIRQADFANAASGREEVKTILGGARDNLKKSARASTQNSHSDAVTLAERAVTDYESVGCDVWRANELAFAYVRLGLARMSLAGNKPSAGAIAAFRRAKTLDPAIDVSEPEFEAAEVVTFKKFAGAVPPPPAPPTEGFWSLARVMGLDGAVEIRAEKKGVLSLRVHKINPLNVKSGKAASKTTGLDASARRELAVTLGFIAPPIAVAVAPTPAPTQTPFAGNLNWTGTDPTPTPKATPVAVAVVTPRKNGNGNVNGGNGRRPTPTPTPVAVAIADPTPERTSPRPTGDLMGNTSWASLTGGVDNRTALYATQTNFVIAPSGFGTAGNARVWYVLGKVWAISAGAAYMRRSYDIYGQQVVATGLDLSAHGLRSDDEEGRWWVGAGASYVFEPGFKSPSGAGLVPAVTRITPSVMGVAQFHLMSRLALRLRGTAGVGLETAETYGNGTGYDVGGEASVTFALTSRVRFTGGAGARRLYTEYQDKQTAVEARRAAWLGIEAGF